MAQAPYLPAPDAAFDSWLTNFSAQLTAAPTDYGLTIGDATATAAVTTAWSDAYAMVTNPATKTAPTVAAKNVARASAEQVVRPLAVRISLNPSVSDELKSGIGVTVRTTTPTPVPPPLTYPILGFLSATPGVHNLKYNDSATPTTKAKPPGAIGVEIWRAVGVTAAIDPAQAKYYQQWTKSPNTSNFDATEAGKIATYFARWITQAGPGGTAQTGPWSAPLSAVIV
jgi:hypothetical protein